MKTPDEIKKALWHCMYVPSCKGCFYYDSNYCSLGADALAYIQQLERERDALLEIAKEHGSCETCKHHYECIMMPSEPYSFDCTRCAETGSVCPCINCTAKEEHWEWCGVKED